MGHALYFLQQCLNAIQVSSFYALLAVAYVLVYGIASRINLAFGATAVWAGHISVGGVTVLVALSPFGLGVTLLLAAFYAALNTCLLGLVVQRGVVRPLLQKPTLAILIATVGLSIVLEELMRIADQGRERWLEPYLSSPIRLIAGGGFSVEITVMRCLIIAISVVLSVGLVVFVSKHRFGRQWRACSQDPGMAALCGVNTDATLALTFLIASAYAAAAGVIIALYYGNVSFYGGTVLGLKTLLAAVIGGLASVGGALAGGLILGFLESFWSAYFAVEYRDLAVFSALILLMIARPKGLFAPSLHRDSARY